MQKAKKLPQIPGVYIFKNRSGKILYVGKATNLRSRVGSYFRGGESGRLIGEMIHEVVDIETQKTDSVLEALILESHLIKKFQPKYNVMGKDDKSFSFFVVTSDEFPRIIILRQTDLEKNKNSIAFQYGPYTSKKQMEIALKIIRKIFPFHAKAQLTEKGCLDFQIGLCPGPYAGAISKKEYASNIRNIQMILEGKKKSLLRKMEKEMKNYSRQEEFEKAAETRNKIFALRHIHDVSLMTKDDKLETGGLKSGDLRIEAYDISNIFGDYAVGSMVVFKNKASEKSQYRKFRIKTVEGSNDIGMMAEVLFRRFRNDWPEPNLILLDGGQGHLDMAKKVLKELDLKILLAAVAKGPNRKNVKIQISNIKLNPGVENILKDKNLVKMIMDEAHRFAIAYHRKLRSKNFRK